ncbi:bifunctional adenosylcobinamide kinase/adenosylcobinamide-phosphate guanylyltransferase [Motilimonas eburnea]|uniref:bifunctional adenosylcobinamide kinase/adenosylcobinamide-phosphate guanylyltransferase n=1 Tax=Motilimonas eburnea TaxID=1737488 RepID=UPI001E55D7CF|nr:bifunctional adenosylcobinamide kinase/adenosylcobinamide-phosphate guanylyltransferase [Motilimonas eburnea]MCE2572568.1 bifunctional adenosylcobinamide kinase/adenosylcobinamide-phosphate guanylyltransferase [Motilimonas eburnea]
MIKLILGGARSGKSRFGEQLAQQSELNVNVLVTAQIFDEEMQQRVAQHQRQRPANWQTTEVPFELGSAITAQHQPGTCLLVDCLTLWVTNELLRFDIEHQREQLDEHWQQQKQQLLNALSAAKQTTRDNPVSADIIMVSNEVGMGIVPMGAINRRFVDETGWLHQSIASLADEVYWVVAGLPQRIK